MKRKGAPLRIVADGDSSAADQWPVAEHDAFTSAYQLEALIEGADRKRKEPMRLDARSFSAVDDDSNWVCSLPPRERMRRSMAGDLPRLSEAPSQEVAIVSLRCRHVGGVEDVPSGLRRGRMTPSARWRFRERNDGTARIAHHGGLEPLGIDPGWRECPSEAQLWYAWKLATNTVLAHVGRAINEALPISVADYAVLSRLELLGRGELAQQDLATSMRWDKSRLSHHLTRMEARGLVRRRSVGTKGVNVVLLAKGASNLAAAKPIHAVAVREHLLAKLNAEQRHQLLQLSTLLHDEPPEEPWPVPGRRE